MSEDESFEPHDFVRRTTPWIYYEYFVLPSYDDFAEDKRNVRLAFNACVAAFQTRDIFWEFCKRHDPSRIAEWTIHRRDQKNVAELTRSLVDRCPDFLLIQSVATAFKHLYPSTKISVVSSPGSVVGLVNSRKGTGLHVKWGDGVHGEVAVKLRDKRSVLLAPALQNVIKFWRDFLPYED